MGKLDKKISGIRELMKDMTIEMYAVENPDLIALDEYIKNLYIKILCTIVQYENDTSKMQKLYLERIVKGIGAEDNLEEYMRKALDISEVDIREFITFMRDDDKAGYYFVLESLVLVSLGDLKQQNMEYLAELIELCEITKDELECLSLVAKSIVQQESSYYDDAKIIMVDEIKRLNFSPYVFNYYKGAIIDSEFEKFYYSPSLELKSDIALPIEYKFRKVSFGNLNICLEEDWYFTGCEKVEFINCKFTASNSATLKFKAVGKVVIDECEFVNFDNHLAIIISVNEIEIRESLFCNCGWTCDGDESGSMFRIKNADYTSLFSFENNIVQRCYIKAKEYRYNYGVTGVLINANNWHTEYRFVDNRFIGCQCINNGNYTPAIVSGTNGKRDNIICSNNVMTGEVTRMFEKN